MERLTLVIELALGKDGKPVPDRYLVRLGSEHGEIILARTRTPLFSAARELIGRGYDPKLMLEMRRVGSAMVALRGRLGEAARKTVIENDRDGPRMARWMPFPGAGVPPESAKSDRERW